MWRISARRVDVHVSPSPWAKRAKMFQRPFKVCMQEVSSFISENLGGLCTYFRSNRESWTRKFGAQWSCTCFNMLLFDEKLFKSRNVRKHFEFSEFLTLPLHTVWKHGYQFWMIPCSLFILYMHVFLVSGTILILKVTQVAFEIAVLRLRANVKSEVHLRQNSVFFL